PGVSRNSFYGPDYASTDLRLTRRLFLHDRVTLDALVESFNLFNHPNRSVQMRDNAFQNAAGDFVQLDTKVGGTTYPAQYVVHAGFLEPTNAYAARQVQFGLRFRF